MKRSALIFFCALPFASRAADGTSSSAALSAPFENTSLSARAAGLGASLLHAADDASSLLVNPSSITSLKRGQISLHHNSWIADVMQETVVFGLPLGGSRASALGITANYVNYGHFEARDKTGRLVGALGASDLGLGIAYARELGSALSAGVLFKSMQQTLADASYVTYSGDFGLTLKVHSGFQVAASYTNFGSAIGGSQRATALRLGAQYAFERKGEMVIAISSAATLRPQGENHLGLGLEADLSGSLFLRGGYDLNLSDAQISGLRGVSAGAGFRAGDVTADYAFVPFGELGNTQRLSLSYSFSNTTPAPRPALTPVAAPPKPQQQVSPPPPLPAFKAAPPAEPGPKAEEGTEFVIKSDDGELELARGLAREGKHREAIPAYSKALEKAPEDKQAWREMGESYLKLGRRDFALRCFEETLRLDPRDLALRQWLEKYRQKLE